MMGRQLDRARPLWRLLLFPRAGGPWGQTVLFRAHHAIADGVALVTPCSSTAPIRASCVPRRPREVAIGKIPHFRAAGWTAVDQLEALNVGLERLRLAWRRARRQSEGGTPAPTDGAREDAGGRASRVLRLPDDNPPALRVPLSRHRVVAWLHDTPLAPLRECARSREVRVNDLLMTALAGAFARELKRRQMELPDDQNLRVSIPVNLRNGRGRELGNRFGLILMDLPIGIQDASTRLQVIASRIARCSRKALEARATLMGLGRSRGLGHLPVPSKRNWSA